MITKKQLTEQLDVFKAAQGKPVMVHSSMKAIGEAEGGAEGLLSVLIEFFTQNGGLLCVPTHTWALPALDLTRPETCIGVLPSVAAAHPDAVRTLHPTHSMAVFGDKKQAEAFAAPEAMVDIPVSPNGSYGKLCEEDGHVLLIGVGHDKNTFLHCVEEMMHVPNRLTKHKEACAIIHKNGVKEIRRIHLFDEDTMPDVSVYFGKYEPAFRYHDCIEDGKIGCADAQLCSARKMKTVMELICKRSQGTELLADASPLPEVLYH